MNKKYVLLSVLLICCLFIFSRQCSDTNTATPIDETESIPEVAQSSEAETSTAEAIVEEESDFLANVQKAITFQNSFNSKFEFYGLVIDQNGDPVEGAKVQMKTRAYKRSIGLKLDYTRDDFIRREEVVYTDSSGRFEFDDGYGSGIRVEAISKEGYVPGRGQKSISFLSTSGAKHHPDPSNPVVYTMWKKGVAEPLVKEEFSFKFNNGDPPQGISLVRGKWIKTNTVDADLIISASMGEPNPERRNQFDWKVTLAPVDGGLIRTNDIFPYEAPDSGYEKTYSFSQTMTDSNWLSSTSDLSFYVKAKNGQIYGSVTIDFNTHPFGDFFTTVKVLVNPNGSRNLEYNPELRIER